MLYHLLLSLYPQVPRAQRDALHHVPHRGGQPHGAGRSAWCSGPWLIRRLRDFQIGQVIRQEGPQSHRAKAGTPTMGGLLILTAALVPTLLWADLTNVYIWIAVLATAAFGAHRLSRRLPEDHAPLVRRPGAALQDGAADRRRRSLVGLALMWLASRNLYNTRLIFPFFKQLIPDLGWFYVPFAAFVLVGVDQRRQPHRRPRRPGDQHVRRRGGGVHRAGLRHRPRACSPTTCCSCAFAPAGGADDLLRRAGRRQPRLPLVQRAPRRDLHGRRRLARARRRARHGRDPDQAGAAAGRSSAASSCSRRCRSIIQVGSFKLTRQARLQMAPLHHHFELIGWSEPKVITRFLIVAIIFALFSLTTLKLR